MSTSLKNIVVMASAAPESKVASDMSGIDLLSSLVEFLRPVIEGRAVSAASTTSNNQNYHTGADSLINGLEGENLLSALTAFVTAIVNPPLGARSKQAESSTKLGVAKLHDTKMNAVAAAPEIPKAVPRSELETKTLSAARAHVFNKMPIRLLAFDKTGSNIQLIGRNEIFSCILPGVFAKTVEPEFQSAWVAAEALKDSNLMVLSARYRQNTMKELLQGIVEQSVNYAILSHTWMRDTPGDVTFQDWATRERNPRGNTKIIKFCEVAAQNHNIKLGWIDSVCINKESSSELDESIRSMYNWYRGASVCITYLAETSHITDAHRDSWFTRGWTLQELLAPVRSVFHNETWNQLGSSSDAEIQSVVEQACGITSTELTWSWRGDIARIPLSRRMQMACGRQVTREEDTSYSLMGILDVDISIAYGEGASRAFFRLVRELVNTKKNVIDIFNRIYDWKEKLLPSSLESYQYRTNWFDYPNGGTQLDDYLPHEPVILTHLGVRVPLLLAPALVSCTSDNEDYVPKGDLFGISTVQMGTRTDGGILDLYWLFFDSRLYTGYLANPHATNATELPDEAFPMYMLAIVNFAINTSGDILLPEQCLGLMVNWDGLMEGNFAPPGNVVIQAGAPLVFKLESKKGLKLHKSNLEEHGLQLVSLHL